MSQEFENRRHFAELEADTCQMEQQIDLAQKMIDEGRRQLRLLREQIRTGMLESEPLV